MEDKYSLTPEENIFLAKRMIVDNIYSSARIEGCNVTFPQTKTILEGVNVPQITLDDINCILNLRDAWKYMISSVYEELNLDYICKINSYVARNESIEWGTLRTGSVGISGTEYIPKIPIKEEVIKKLQEINSIQQLTKRAISYMLYGMRSQLFWDGNKRSSIIIANKILTQNGKGILTIKDKNLQEFNTLLTEYYNTNDEKTIEEFLYNNCIFGIEK